MAAKDSSNLEHATLVSLTDTLVKAISLDQSDVALKLVAANIIPPSSITSDSKAADIFDKVLKAVEINPENYEKFLSVIDQRPCIKNQADVIRKQYTEKKQQQSEIQEETETGQVSPPVKRKSRATRLHSESAQEQETKFPYLKDESMTEEERKRLIGRLKLESGRMKNEFAILVDRAKESLQQKKVSAMDLEVLVMHSTSNDLAILFKEGKNIHELFCDLSKYWSFFDYEFLALIIKRHCPELSSELDKYEDHLKIFCQRRLCEIPSDIFQTKIGHKYNLYVKYNQKVDVMKLETAKELELKLSELLDTDLYLLEVQEGCVELVFHSLCDLDKNIPLRRYQQLQLTREMEVIQLRIGDYIFPSSDTTGPDSDTESDSGNETMSTCTTDSTDFQNPLEVTNKFHVVSYKTAKFPGYGKWLIFRNLEDLEETWRELNDEVATGRLKVVGMKCSTLYYDPSCTGAGPRTIGKIAVYTNKDDWVKVGMELVKLVQHDIKYKTTETTLTEGRFSHLPGVHPITSLTIFWNDGVPYASEHPRPGTKLCPTPCRNDRYNYEPEKDIWKLNIVEGQTQENFHGKWILVSNYNTKSDINITRIWHKLKANIEAGELPVIKMECPAPKYHGGAPEIHISTSQRNMDAVGEAIISMVEHDILYVIGQGLFRADEKTLFWNSGRPSYEDAQHTRSGITGNWRDLWNINIL